MMLTLTILGMAAVTVLLKTSLFLAGDRIHFPPLVREALGYVPVTVLTAIIAPMVFMPNNKGLEIGFDNPQLFGGIAAVLVCALTRKTLPTIVVGLGVYFVWKFVVLA